MKPKLTWIKKTVAVSVSIIAAVIILAILFISPIAKYLIQKYDVKYTGREIKLDWIYVNPFTGYIHINDLKIYEVKSDSVFFSADGLSANLEMHKLFSKTYELSELTLTKPIGVISQNISAFNFDDLITRFTSQDSLPKKITEPLHFNILGIKIKEGTFYYYERSIPVSYSIKEVNIETEGKTWNVDTLLAKFSLISGIGSGVMKGDITLNLKSLDYRFAVLASKFDLSVLQQYLKDISYYGNLKANFDADVKAKGNFTNSEDIDAKGYLSLNDFHFGKNKTEDYASFKKLVISAKELSPKNKKYSFDSLSLMQPYFKYELYDHLDNLQYMFGKKGQKVVEAKATSGNTNFLFQIADYVKTLAKNFFKSNYKINRLAIYKADMRYVDYSLSEKFEASASELNVFADSIEKSDKWVDLTFRTQLKPYGKASLDLSINPKDSSDFTIKYHLSELSAAMFNPYLITYTSFPLDRGTIELKGNWHVNNGIIQSNNHFIVLDPRITKRAKGDGAKYVPLKLFMFFIRERGNVIDYEIPITGNLKNPKFKLKDVFLDALTNLFVKPVTIPYRTEVRNIENEIENAFSISWEMRKNSLQPKQEKFINELLKYLKNDSKASLTITPVLYAEKEKEYILFFEAKKMFYIATTKGNKEKLTKEDTVSIERISVKDSVFIHYLNKHVGKEMLFTTQSKCEKLVGINQINSLLNKLRLDRKKVFTAYFSKEELANKVKFMPGHNAVPYNGFSFYKIAYSGEWPEDLRRAYNKMADLNNESPRKKFNREREQNRKLLQAR